MTPQVVVARAEWHGIRLINCSVVAFQTSVELKATGLLTIMGDVVHLHTGVAMGPVRITYEALESAPDLDSEGWEDIAEVSFTVGSGPLMFVGPMEDEDEDGPRLDAHGPGIYRLRIHGRNRDEDYDLAVTETHEEYLVTSWPTQTESLNLIAASSRVSREWAHKHPGQLTSEQLFAAVTVGPAGTDSAELRRQNLMTRTPKNERPPKS